MPAVLPRLASGFSDFVAGMKMAPIWGALGWDQTIGRFKRTLLGPFWLSSGLLAIAVALSFIFGGLLGQHWQVNFPMVLLGILSWVIVGTPLSDAGTVFINSASLMQLQKMPVSFLVFLHMYRAVVNFGAQLITALVVLALTGLLHTPSWTIIPGFLIVYVNSFMLSLILSIPSTRFRDLGHGLSLAVQILFFCTPIFWNADQMSPHRKFVIELNPLAHEVNLIRKSLMGQMPSTADWASTIGMALAATLVAWVLISIFRKRIIFWL